LLGHFQSQQTRITVGEFRRNARFAWLLGWDIHTSRKPAQPQVVWKSRKVARMDQGAEVQHLVKLKLMGTRLLEHDATMELLGKLPKLEILVLLMLWSSFECEELDFKSPQGGIAFGSLRVFTLKVTANIKSIKFDERAMPKLERLQVTREPSCNEIDFSGLAFLPSINEVQVRVYFLLDYDRINAAPDPETHNKILEEERQEQRRKKGELKKKIQEQLAQNTNEPILTVTVDEWTNYYTNE